MEKYKQLYLWACLPFIIVQAGIFSYYWPKFSDVFWEIHIHYWLVSAWYLLFIVQTYLISRKKLDNHRLFGMLSFVIAGGVIFSAISILDLPLKLAATYTSERPGPPIAFYYGTLIIEFILALAFALAIVKSIIHRKDIHEHSWWLICSLFYLMVPALGRGMIVFWRSILPPESFSPAFPLISTELVYISLFLAFAFKFGKLRHMATYIAFGLVIVRALRIPIGSSETVQAFLNQVIRW